MDSTKKHVKVSPEESASPFSVLFYWWILPFLKYGYQNDIGMKDVYNTTQADQSGPLGDELQENWEREILSYIDKQKNKPSLKNAIFRTFWKSFILSGAAIFVQFIIIKTLQPVVLAKYINFFDTNNKPYLGWIWGCGVVLLALANVVLYHSTMLATQRIGMRIRTAVSSLTYRKLLKLNHKSLGETAAGQLVNLMSNDVQRFDVCAASIHFIWIMPIYAVLTFYILYIYVGIIAAVTGMAFISLESIPLQGTISRWQGVLRYKIALRTDKRIKLMSELTSGIQVIKMYAWEKPFEKIVEMSRKYEIDVIAKTSYLYGILSATSVFTERLILYVTLIPFVLLGHRLTGGIAFSLANLFNNIQLVMAINFPRALSSYNEANVSIARLEKFLLLEEVEEETVVNEKHGDHVGCINLNNVTASWSPKSIVPTLIDIDLHLRCGTLCCVVGNVGSGKSSLLQLFLRELPITSGYMNIAGKISYASQEPWLFVSNVKDNILFGKSFNKKRYQDVIKVCSLERDLKQLPYGDKTLVGERGKSLSGGQKARINLARAVYTEADIYLFDDPLSAVDTKVGKHLFDECITKYLNGKTRILVTHQLQYMKKSDLIVIINNGKIDKVAKFHDLTEHELNLLQQTPEIDDKDKEKMPTILETKIPKVSSTATLQSASSLASSIPTEEPGETGELIEKGDLSTSLYWEYFRSGTGIGFLLFTGFMFIFSQIITNASDLWLSHWTNVEARRYVSTLNLSTEFISTTISSINNHTVTDMLKSVAFTNTNPQEIITTADPSVSASKLSSNMSSLELENFKSEGYYIWVYSALIIAVVILQIWRCFLYYQVCMSSSKALHNKMFHNILQAPMRFFDTNPSGRILNRFSKDMGAVDELLPSCQIDAIQILMVFVGILVMVVIVNPWMILTTIIIGPVLFILRKMYLKTAQSVKRLEGISKAPVFSHISASLFGITTIRASNAEKMVTTEFDILQDQHSSTWFLFLVSGRVFGFYLDVICCIFLAIVTIQFLLFRDENTLSGNVGLAISHSYILTGMVQMGIRQSVEVASHMISVERILQYTKLEKDGVFESLPAKKPPRDWPNKGKIIFKNTFLRYALNMTPSLRDLSIDIKSGEKVGIVGRTGAGKSTLIASLFRLAPVDGEIIIDDIETGGIGLHDLRTNISIIPQDPVLFSASVRYNLDPFEKHSDEILWKALENVELKGVVTDLNQPVSEGGSNFSAGQRQLICLARAIVRNNKILVMDEATANVDPQTDALIQKTIRERFRDCTVLTVAHRLNTIMDSDRVLVMDAGQAVEFDHAYRLLQNSDGHFAKFLKDAGPPMANKLRDIAKEDYYKKHTSPEVIVDDD
uniref:Multidrug resistance-associated protein 4-like n=1 Tax=Diabrotica virgifera virgifera TaxID=50390 RepID=A0A6P7GCD8_DIAVI